MTQDDKDQTAGRDDSGASDESKRDLPGSAPQDRTDHTQDDISENKCPQCGEPVHEKRVTCPNCGYEYTDDEYTTGPDPDEFSTEDTSFMEEDRADEAGGEERPPGDADSSEENIDAGAAGRRQAES